MCVVCYCSVFLKGTTFGLAASFESAYQHPETFASLHSKRVLDNLDWERKWLVLFASDPSMYRWYCCSRSLVVHPYLHVDNVLEVPLYITSRYSGT